MEILDSRFQPLRDRTFPSLPWLASATLLAALLGFAAPAGAQFDFAGALTVKMRTYPVKRQQGRPAPGKDGMPQPEALRDGRPVNLEEFPAVPVDDNFPGGSMLDALRHYQKQAPVAALPAMLGLLTNGYLELEIEKPCSVDSIKLQYDHRPTHAVPSFQEAGLGALMQIVTDGARATELARTEERLRDRYNSGLSGDRKRDQENMALLRALRYAIALRYDPRVKVAASPEIRSGKAKQLFKAEVAMGRPVEGEFFIGPIHLVVKAKLSRNKKSPVPPSCKSSAGLPGAVQRGKIAAAEQGGGGDRPSPYGKRRSRAAA